MVIIRKNLDENDYKKFQEFQRKKELRKLLNEASSGILKIVEEDLKNK